MRKFGKNNLGEKRKKGEIRIKETGKNVIKTLFSISRNRGTGSFSTSMEQYTLLDRSNYFIFFLTKLDYLKTFGHDCTFYNTPIDTLMIFSVLLLF